MKVSSYKITIALIGFAMYAGMVILALLAAGTWRLPYLWATLGVQVAACGIGIWFLSDDLIRERAKPAGDDRDAGAAIILSVLVVASIIAPALDVGRLHISDTVPDWLRVVALIFNAVGWAGFMWSMAVNSFFSSAIRLQPDRAQYVVMTGPYQWVRHPGYAFAALAHLMQPIAIGSWLSLVPSIFIVIDLIHRTNLEESILHEGLPGYREYAQRVRYRLLPGVW